MPLSRNPSEHITPPNSFTLPLPTPPRTDEKFPRFKQASEVINFFQKIKAGLHDNSNPWKEFQLAAGDYLEIQRQLKQDPSLLGFVQDKIRYDYFGADNRLVIRMPSELHESFIEGVEDSLRSQLKGIRAGPNPDRTVRFARNLRIKRSTDIPILPYGSPRLNSHHSPDTSFRHRDARYPGVVIEVSYTQKRKDLYRLAEDYLLGSEYACVQAVVGLDLEYGGGRTKMATLSVWRHELVDAQDGQGKDFRVKEVLKDEVFRDKEGDATDHPGLRLQLSDFAKKMIVDRELGDANRDLVISAQELCEILAVAEDDVERAEADSRESTPPGVNKRFRSPTPPEQLRSPDKKRFKAEENAALLRQEEEDSDYKPPSQESSKSA